MKHPRQAAVAVFALTMTMLAVPGLAQTSPGPTVAHFTLANGFEVVVVPDRRAPVVTHMLWYKVGAADETPGKSGLAHFLEHLMFKGTKKNPLALFSQTVANFGGQENAFTSHDYTAFYQRVPRERLPILMEFEADRMTGLALTDDAVKPELNVVLEEQNMTVANSPGARLSEQIDAALYLNHPYGRPVIGWRQEIEKLDRVNAIAFYQRFYGPNNAILVVAGDVDANEVRSLAESTYGKVERRFDVLPRARPQEPPPAAKRSVTLADPRVEQPSLQRSYLVPSVATAKPGESEALEVLAHILGRGANSRLYRALVVEKGMALSAGASYSGSSLDPTRFSVYGAPTPDVSLSQLEDAIDAVLADISDKGVTPEELERSKTRLIADAAYAQDNQMTLARWYGVALTTGSSVESVRTWPDRISAVTANAIRDAARQWFDKRRSVTGYLIKDTTAPHEEKRS